MKLNYFYQLFCFQIIFSAIFRLMAFPTMLPKMLPTKEPITGMAKKQYFPIVLLVKQSLADKSRHYMFLLLELIIFSPIPLFSWF